MSIESDQSQEHVNLSPDQAVERFLRNSPSGPDFGQSTISYCESGITAGLSKIESVLVRQHPGKKDDIKRQIRDFIAEPLPFRAGSDFSFENGKLKLTTHGEKPETFEVQNSLFWTIFKANPELGLSEYLLPMFPDKRGGDPKNIQTHYPSFMSRFKQIMELGDFSGYSPIAQIAALAFATQVAKNFATDKVKQFVERRAKPYGGFSAEGKSVEEYLETSILPALIDARHAEAYIANGARTINKIAEDANLGTEQLKLIFDMCFINRGEFGNPELGKEALAPILRYMSEGNWERAFILRNFLLSHFSDAFPVWRTRELQEKGEHYDSLTFSQIKQSIRNGELRVDELEIPEEYLEDPQSRIARGLDAETAAREKDIQKKTIKESESIMKTVANATTGVILRDIVSDYFTDYGDIQAVSGYIKTSGYLNDRHSVDGFINLMAKINPRMPDEEVRSLHDTLIRRYFSSNWGNLGDMKGGFWTTWVIRTPEVMNIAGITFKDGEQKYRELKGTEKFTNSLGAERYKPLYQRGSWSDVLYKLIESAISKPAGRPVLDSVELREAIKRGWRSTYGFSDQKPKHTYNLYEYLRTMVYKAKPDLEQTDPVYQFVESFKD